MFLQKKILKALTTMTMVIILIQTGACGFILYPERKGLNSGKIDPGVAILDAILLIPGILPGVVAFAVDFVTGCIYLPGSHFSVQAMEDVQNPQDLTVVSQNLDLGAIEHMISQKTGKQVHLEADQIKVLRANDPEFIRRYFNVPEGDKDTMIKG
ncbi:MAG: hypothetical protein KKD44_02750 [Proteobacteria bacterium]|nr:hypothetical protein [Pseudomonadota bacterium]